ncbi:MAG: amidohydrolase, partial [Gammaproteobacteria bacterium]|nr:amidohydrolase [Gammaproteobacteria bacterium]
MERFTVISSDCHAGLPPEQYREYLDPQHREVFDMALPMQQALTDKAEQVFLVKEANEQWRAG